MVVGVTSLVVEPSVSVDGDVVVVLGEDMRVVVWVTLHGCGSFGSVDGAVVC